MVKRWDTFGGPSRASALEPVTTQNQHQTEFLPHNTPAMGSHGYAHRGGSVPARTSHQTGEPRRGLRPEEWAVRLIEAFVHFMMMRRDVDSQDEVTSAQRKTRFRDERRWRSTESLPC